MMDFLSLKKQWPHLQTTLLNIDWLKKNEKNIKNIFPKNYTPIRAVSPVVIGIHFTLLGVPYRSAEELHFIMYLLRHTGILLTQDTQIKPNPRSIFKTERKTPKFSL